MVTQFVYFSTGSWVSSDPELFVDQVGNLSTSKETVLILGLLFLQTDFPFEMGIMGDLVHC